MATYFNNPIPPIICPMTYVEGDWDIVEPENELDYTVSFYPDFDYWLCFHDYHPSGIFATRINLFSFDNKRLYIHNSDNYVKYYGGVIHKSIITPVFRSPYIQSNKTLPALFQNINFRCDVIDNKVVNRDKTFSRLSFHTSYQSTNKITLVPFISNQSMLSQYNTYNIRLVNTYWQFNKIRDLKLDKIELTWEEWDKLHGVVYNQNIDEIEVNTSNVSSTQNIQMKRRFVDDYMVVIMEFDNDEQNEFLLHDINYLTSPVLR